MKHTYKITGMTCGGCKAHVQKSLESVDDVESVVIDLPSSTADIEMQKHIPIEKLKHSLEGSNYMIHGMNEVIMEKQKVALKSKDKSETYYCPMHCEGEKTYDKSGDCPVCGMDLVVEASAPTSAQFTCPMHPEVIKNEAGSCPKCGMELVPLETDESAEQKTYNKLTRKVWIATAFTLPIFINATPEMIPNNPLYDLTGMK